MARALIMMVAGNADMVPFSDGSLVTGFGAAIAGATLVQSVTLEGGDYRTTLVCPFRAMPRYSEFETTYRCL